MVGLCCEPAQSGSLDGKLPLRIELLEWMRSSMSRMMETRHLNPPLLAPNLRPSIIWPAHRHRRSKARPAELGAAGRWHDMAWQAICRLVCQVSLPAALIIFFLLASQVGIAQFSSGFEPIDNNGQQLGKWDEADNLKRTRSLFIF